MKNLLTLLTTDEQLQNVLMYLFFVMAGLLITYFFFRWLFAIDKRVKQNDCIINLLKLIAKRHGATDTEINNSITKTKLDAK